MGTHNKQLVSKKKFCTINESNKIICIPTGTSGLDVQNMNIFVDNLTMKCILQKCRNQACLNAFQSTLDLNMIFLSS